MFARDIFRSSRWHSVRGTFALVQGPSIVSLSQTSITIRWTMSEVCSGQIEWGTSSGSYPYSTTEDTSYTFSSHTQTIAGLTPSTTIYYRSKSTSQAGVTVYSTERTAQTDGVAPSTGIGPRYDFYGAGASGDFPTYPTIGGTVKLLPAATAAQGASAVAAWINSNAASGDTIVFDSSGGGTDWGAGTLITTDDVIQIDNGDSTLKSNVTLNGYNTKIHNTALDAAASICPSLILAFEGGGFEDWTVQGFWLHGANVNVRSWSSGWNDTTSYFGSQSGSGIHLNAYQNFTIEDVKITETFGDGILSPAWDITHPRHYAPFGVPNGLTVRYCHIDGVLRQGITIDNGDDFSIHHNIIENTGIYPIDCEDGIHNAIGRLVNVSITDNTIRRWSWTLVYPNDDPTQQLYGWVPFAIVFSTSIQDGMSYYENIDILRNRFEQGSMGYGNPAAEIAVTGGPIYNGCGHVIAMGTPWDSADDKHPPMYGVTISDNVIQLNADQTPEATSCGARSMTGVIVRDGVNVTVQNNDLQSRPIDLYTCTSTTVTNNGASPVAYL